MSDLHPRTLERWQKEVAEMDDSSFTTHLEDLGYSIETEITDAIDSVQEIRTKLAIRMGEPRAPKNTLALLDLHEAWSKLESALQEAHGRYGDVDYA